MMAASCLISGPLESLCVVSVSGAATSVREDSNCTNLKEGKPVSGREEENPGKNGHYLE